MGSCLSLNSNITNETFNADFIIFSSRPSEIFNLSANTEEEIESIYRNLYMKALINEFNSKNNLKIYGYSISIKSTTKGIIYKYRVGEQ